MKNIIEKKEVVSTSLKQFVVIHNDETGAITKVRYFCPHCSTYIEQLIFLENYSFEDLIPEFEIMIDCQECGEKLCLDSELY